MAFSFKTTFASRVRTAYIGKPVYRPYERAAIKLQVHGDPSTPISFRNIWVREIDQDDNRASSPE